MVCPTRVFRQHRLPFDPLIGPATVPPGGEFVPDALMRALKDKSTFLALRGLEPLPDELVLVAYQRYHHSSMHVLTSGTLGEHAVVRAPSCNHGVVEPDEEYLVTQQAKIITGMTSWRSIAGWSCAVCGQRRHHFGTISHRISQRLRHPRRAA